VTRYIGLDYKTVDASPDLVSDALYLPFPSSSFATVFSTQTLEHLIDPFQAFSEMARILNTNGVLILTAPQSWREHEIPRDYFRFTSFGLRKLCKRAGLKVIRLKLVGRAWSHVGQSLLNILLQTKLGMCQ
jgi:ubiquinone/menaquinone biosynthesis C-methylase UbiE